MNRGRTYRFFALMAWSVFVFGFETVVYPLLIGESWLHDHAIYPRLTLTIVLFCGIFGGRRLAMGAGLLIGLTQDTLYMGHMIGVHALAYAVVGYGVGVWQRKGGATVFSATLRQACGLLVCEWIVFACYRLFRLYDQPLEAVFFTGMVPSVVGGTLFALCCYWGMRAGLEGATDTQEPEDSEKTTPTSPFQ